MLLLARFFSYTDFFLVPICVGLLWLVIRNRAERHKSKELKRVYYRGFWFKVICVLLYTTATELYFKGGDTGLYYQSIKDFRAAINDDFNHLGDIVGSMKLHINHPITPYFYYDNYEDDFTYNYMLSPSNYFIPKLGLLPATIFLNNYLCINLVFGFFALGGAIRLFRTFYYYYPGQIKQIALAAILLPSVGFWSAGLLKDPICFGCIGYILYAAHNVFIKKTKFRASILWMIICGYLLFYIKVYILLVLLLSITIWLFAETNKFITDKTLRRIFSFITLVLSAGIAVFLLNYFTSQEAAQQYKLDTLLEQTARQRRAIESVSVEGGSGFSINTSNPVSLVFNSIVATFFRPFIWEVNTPIALFSAIESGMFLVLTLNFFFKRSVGKYFKFAFSDPRLLMCFMFSVIFAIAVGASTNNFGALSRYKIPCMPFYFLLLMMVYVKAALPYPKWFQKLINKVA